jgi:hypothetical protein
VERTNADHDRVPLFHSPKKEEDKLKLLRFRSLIALDPMIAKLFEKKGIAGTFT